MRNGRVNPPVSVSRRLTGDLDCERSPWPAELDWCRESKDSVHNTPSVPSPFHSKRKERGRSTDGDLPHTVMATRREAT